MNSRFLHLLHITTLLLCWTCIASASPVIQIGQVTISSSGTGILPILLTGGTEPYAGINAKIVLPTGIHCLGVSRGSSLSGSFLIDHRVVNGAQDVVTLLTYSGSSTFINGEIFLLQISADNYLTDGTYPVTFALTKADTIVNAKFALSNNTGTNSVPVIPQVGYVQINNSIIEGEPEGNFDGEPDGEGEAENEAEGEGEGNELSQHSADQNGDNKIDLSELLRVIQFYNSAGYYCANPPASTEDGYIPGLGINLTCRPHACDYNPQDWRISLSELLRIIQFYNSGGYHACSGSEDGYCPGPPVS